LQDAHLLSKNLLCMWSYKKPMLNIFTSYPPVRSTRLATVAISSFGWMGFGTCI
jgi:hypothetical protein